MAPVAQESAEYIKLEVSHKISNITLTLYQADREANELVLLNTIREAFDSPLVTIPNVVDLTAASVSERRNLLSVSSSIQISYKIQSSTQSTGADSAEAEATLGRHIEHSVQHGEFQKLLREFADVLGATALRFVVSTEEGFSVQPDSSDEDSDGTLFGYDETTALVIFVVTISILVVLLCVTYGRALSCPVGKRDEPMSLADQARRNAQNFDVNGEDLEMTWVQTDRGLVRTTRRREDMVRTPLSTGRSGKRYQGIGSSDSQGERDDPSQESRPSSASATDPFSDESPIFDLLGDTPSRGQATGPSMSVSPSTGSMLPHGVGTGKKISINLKGVRGANNSMTAASRQQDDGMDDFLAIAARSDHQGSPAGGSDEVDEILF